MELPKYLSDAGWSGYRLIGGCEYIFSKNAIKENSSKNKTLLIVTGISGAGKDSIVDVLTKNSRFKRVKTATTRPRRSSEMESDEYIRLSVEQFKQDLAEGKFLESNEYAGNFYGTPISEIKKTLENAEVAILRIDPNGTRTVVSLKDAKVFEGVNIITVFVAPENLEEIFGRLLDRGSSEIELKSRQAQNQIDLAVQVKCDYLLINKNNKLAEVANELEKQF